MRYFLLSPYFRLEVLLLTHLPWDGQGLFGQVITLCLLPAVTYPCQTQGTALILIWKPLNRRILRARESGKIAALMSNLCQNASDPPSVDVSSTSFHCQSYSDDLPDDHETSSELKIEGHIYFAVGHLSAGEPYEDAFRAAVEEQFSPTVPVLAHCMETFYNSAVEPDRALLKLPIQGYVQAKSASQ